MIEQPFLHDLVVAVSAPTTVLCGPDGQIRRGGVQGGFDGDTRVLSCSVVTVDGAEPVPIAQHRLATDRHRYLGVLRGLGDDGCDPTVVLERVRHLDNGAIVEQITLVSQARETVTAHVRCELDCDFATMSDIKAGVPSTSSASRTEGRTLAWDGPQERRVEIRAEAAGFAWDVTLEPHSRATTTITLTSRGGPAPAVVRAPAAPPRRLSVRAEDARLHRLVTTSLDDLDGLRLADPLAPSDLFLGAGAPWYLTLFGRDSLWAAHMLLPLGTELAAGTLRTLARRQGRRHDPEAEEQPGKILHEVRAVSAEHPHSRAGHGLALAPTYYGTVDATALWITLLHDAWRWGLPAGQVAELLPALEAALGWLGEDALDADGFVSYQDSTGHGLANQGWKDSRDSIQFRDGTLASPPVALCEAQGYAVAAARRGAAILDAFGRAGADRWRAWAGALTDRFRARFWIREPADGGVPYPAIALDGRGRAVDTVTSNIGHLLGTGLLDDAETAAVVARLGSAELDSGHGLRTMGSSSAGFNPLSYHGGSVWAHDTAIVIAGLARVGTPDAHRVVASLARGLVDAAESFGYQTPELFSGETATSRSGAVPYPASCHPQAWSAAAAVVLVAAATGIRPDVPGGTIGVAPLRPSPFGAITVRGIRIGDADVHVEVGRDGTVDVGGALAGLRVVPG